MIAIGNNRTRGTSELANVILTSYNFAGEIPRCDEENGRVKSAGERGPPGSSRDA